MGSKVRVVIFHSSTNMSHSRFGYVPKIESLVRYVDRDGIDDLVSEFRRKHDVIRVDIGGC